MREEYCPVCGACVYTMYVRGPESARVVPCGHDIHPLAVRESDPSDANDGAGDSEPDASERSDDDTE